MPSEVEIVNLALGVLGKAALRDFSVAENDPFTGRLANRVYIAARDHYLSVHDWSFARATATLKMRLNETHPEGVVYALPSDCFVPRRLGPRVGSPNKWSVEGRNVIVPTARATSFGAEPILRYTKQVTNTGYFMPYFVTALYTEIASRLAMPLNCDSEVASAVRKEAKMLLAEAKLIDSNIGEGDDHVSQDLLYDTFVAVDIPVETFNDGSGTT